MSKPQPLSQRNASGAPWPAGKRLGLPGEEREALVAAFESATSEGSHQGKRVSSRDLVAVRALVAPGGVDQFERDFLSNRFDALQPLLTGDGQSAARDLLSGELVPSDEDVPSRPATTPQAKALELGRRFLGYGTNDLRDFSAFPGGPDAFSCTRFVTWLLVETGQLDQLFQVGDDLKAHALATPGWSEVAPDEARPGDVVRVEVDTSAGPVLHTVMLSRILDDGSRVYLGANYTDRVLDIQTVTESRLPGAKLLWALRHDANSAGAEP